MRYDDPKENKVYGCAVALADTAGNASSLVMVCRTLYGTIEADVLVLAQQIAREDFPYINP